MWTEDISNHVESQNYYVTVNHKHQKPDQKERFTKT